MEQVYFLLAAAVTFAIMHFITPEPRFSSFDTRPKQVVAKQNVVHVDFKKKRRLVA